MLSTVQNPPHRRGHAHRRSAAISGDFDAMGMDFFKAPNSTISQSLSQSLPQENTLKPTPPSLVITEPAGFKKDCCPTSPTKKINSKHPPSTSTSTPSPQKKHTRLNSWAHSFIKPKKNDSSTLQDYNFSSSNEVTPENLTKSLQFTYGAPPPQQQQSYDVPEALIDLDRASGIFHDPSSKIPKKNSYHRRTESAPELEDFLKYKIFSSNNQINTTNNQSHQKNSAIFEEEEDEYIDEDVLSSASSNNNNLNKNPSLNSLNSNHGLRLNSPAPVENSTFSTPTSIKTNNQQRRGGGATAARYQSYYNNSLALSNALKSSESLSQITNGSNSINQKPSISSLTNNNYNNTKSILSSASSINSSVLNSPSRFKFESKIYDIQPNEESKSIQPPQLASSSPTSSSSSSTKSLKQITSPSKQSKRLYIHKKSNSLLSSISLRIRRNSSTSQIKQQSDDEDEEDDIGDSTITPFNFGEPGPELDLTTMTPKFDNNNNDKFDQVSSPKKSNTPHHHKKFFNWLKK